jgi:hypothetical protein
MLLTLTILLSSPLVFSDVGFNSNPSPNSIVSFAVVGDSQSSTAISLLLSKMVYQRSWGVQINFATILDPHLGYAISWTIRGNTLRVINALKAIGNVVEKDNVISPMVTKRIKSLECSLVLKDIGPK